MALTAEQLTEIKTLFPESEREALTADNAAAMCDARLRAFARFSLSDADTLALSTETGTPAPSLDPEVAGDRRERVDERLTALVTAGQIAPADRESWALALRGTDEAPDCYMLAREGDGKKVKALSILDLVSKIKPLALGEKTGRQALSREVPGGKDEKETKALEDANNVILNAAKRGA